MVDGLCRQMAFPARARGSALQAQLPSARPGVTQRRGLNTTAGGRNRQAV
jgi:hypothetical protein